MRWFNAHMKIKAKLLGCYKNELLHTVVMSLSNADIKVLALLYGSFKFDQRHAPQKSIFLFVTADKRLWISHESLAAPFNKCSCKPEN